MIALLLRWLFGPIEILRTAIILNRQMRPYR